MQAHRQITYTKVGTTKGQPRLWLESLKLAACGFEPGAKYTVTLDLDARRVVLRIGHEGDRVVSARKRTLSSGQERLTPIIDIANASLREAFEEGQRIRAVLCDGEITFDLHPMEAAKAQREARTRANLEAGTLHEATLCTGGGVSTWALKEGLQQAGVHTVVDWVVDRDGRYLQVALDNNPAITAETRLYEASLEEIDLEALTPVDCIQVSLPCTGHSLSGKSKRKISCAEDHPTDALAVFGLLRILEAVQPSIVISENVPQAMDSASYAIVRAYLLAQGYDITERVLNGSDAGTVENRERWWFAAISSGLNTADFDLDALAPEPQKYASLGELMEPVADDDQAWKDFAYLEAKAKRDKAAGKGFARQLVDADSTRIGTVGRGYAKVRSTEPHIVRADGKQRLLTPVEHARAKGIPEQLVTDVSATMAHEILGQSILFGHALSIGRALGHLLMGRAGRSPQACSARELVSTDNTPLEPLATVESRRMATPAQLDLAW